MLRKPKNIIIGVALVFTIAGLLSLAHNQLPPVSSPPTTVPTSKPPTKGQVTASDERAESAPYSHSVTPPPANPPAKNTTVASAGTVEPYVDKPVKYLTINNKQYPIRTYEALMTPNDPLASQWWVSNSKMDQAWDIPAGSNDTLLAVIDTGIALNHEEFASRLFKNTGEQGSTINENPSQRNCTDRGLALNANCNLVDDDGDGIVDEESGSISYQNPSRLNCTDQARPLDKSCNRIDDDLNDFVDDVDGWDFANMDNSPQAGEINPTGTGTTHATRVTGVAAAAGNNNKGVAGVDWHTKILPIQALSDNAIGDTYGVGRAILYAASMGADVISLSLGSDLPDQYVRETVRIASQAGSLVVASSGNDGCDCMVYPANYPEVLAVGALDSNNAPASFSSYGANLDILAPGTNMTSSNWTAGNPTGAYVSGINGTSYSAPFVSGLLTRLLSQQPTATPLQLIAALTENSNRLTLASTIHRSNTLGFGKVDAQLASSRMANPRTDVQTHELTRVSRGSGLDANNPLEATDNYRPLYCGPDKLGTTPLFFLSKSGSELYTISQNEVWTAQAAGYSSSLFTYACLSQPHDAFGSVKSLDTFKEFRNNYTHF